MSSELNKTDIEEDKQIIENKKEYIKSSDKNNNNKNEEEMKNEKQELLENVEFSKIIGNYLLFDQIGMGSFSKVTKAIHLITEETVAVKILEKEKIEDDIDIERIIREIEILKTIMHPNIAQIYETYSTVHNIYLMMEYVEGGDLFDYITKNIYLSEPIACHIYRQIISVLDYLTEMGISHRDIKPENILLDENSKAYLTDFGWSNYIRNHRIRNTICGTPLYLPPEMVAESGHNEKADIWCIGVLLFELSTGKVPFEGNDYSTVKYNISRLNISWPSDIEPDIKDLISKILKKNPNERLSIEKILSHNFFSKY